MSCIAATRAQRLAIDALETPYKNAPLTMTTTTTATAKRRKYSVSKAEFARTSTIQVFSTINAEANERGDERRRRRETAVAASSPNEAAAGSGDRSRFEHQELIASAQTATASNKQATLSGRRRFSAFAGHTRAQNDDDDEDDARRRQHAASDSRSDEKTRKRTATGTSQKPAARAQSLPPAKQRRTASVATQPVAVAAAARRTTRAHLQLIDGVTAGFAARYPVRERRQAYTIN